jgi:hypothetical protein
MEGPFSGSRQLHDDFDPRESNSLKLLPGFCGERIEF